MLAGYVPKLQSEGLIVRFLNERVGGTIPSPVILGKIGDAYVHEIHAFADAHSIPELRFGKDDVKEDIAREHMQSAERDGRTGVVMLGIAQEKAFAWRGGGTAAMTRTRTSASPARRCSSTTSIGTSLSRGKCVNTEGLLGLHVDDM